MTFRMPFLCAFCQPLFKRYLTQSRHYGGALVGLSPKQSSKPPQIEIWNIINQWSFCQIFRSQAPLHKRKASLLKTFWQRF